MDAERIAYIKNAPEATIYVAFYTILSRSNITTLEEGVWERNAGKK